MVEVDLAMFNFFFPCGYGGSGYVLLLDFYHVVEVDLAMFGCCFFSMWLRWICLCLIVGFLPSG